MDRSAFLSSLAAAVAAGTLKAGAAGLPTVVAGVEIPQTSLAKEATAVALSSEPIEIFRHSLRTFLFAELIATKRGIEHDRELVYVASILHDTGLSSEHMSENDRFEVDGANLSRALLQQHGVERSKSDLVWDAISLHDQGNIAKYKQPEVMLVSAGVGADFGAFLPLLERKDIVAVLQASPRDNFVTVFLASTAALVRKKPGATGNSWVTDVGYRMVPGFHLENFVDEVREDPFAGYESEAR
jgi:HD domain-containing protein